jgi:hypothetical protein
MILDALGDSLGVSPEPDAIIGRIATVQSHLAQGIIGTFPPRLLDRDPYTGSFSPREWVSYFLARIGDAADRARIERRSLLTGKRYHATDAEETGLDADGADFSRTAEDSPLLALLRDAADGMPAMTPWQTAAGFAAYAALAVALAALMFATAHVPAAQAALGIFMG